MQGQGSKQSLPIISKEPQKFTDKLALIWTEAQGCFEKIHHDAKASSISDHDPWFSKMNWSPLTVSQIDDLSWKTKSEQQMTKRPAVLESTEPDAS